MAKYTNLRHCVVIVFFLGSLLGSELSAAIPASESVCVYQGDNLVLGTIQSPLEFSTNFYNLRQLAEIEVSQLSTTPLQLFSTAESLIKTPDNSVINVTPCTVVGASFFVELDNAVLNFSNDIAWGNGYVFSEDSIKKIASQYVPHFDTFSSVVYDPDEIRSNRLRLLPLIRDAKSKSDPITAGAKARISPRTHTIDIMWDTKKLFSGKASFEHNGNETRHRKELLGCALREYFRIPFPDVEIVAEGSIALRSSELSPPYRLVIDNRLSATFAQLDLIQHKTEPTRYQISPLLWQTITEKLIEARNLYYFR